MPDLASVLRAADDPTPLDPSSQQAHQWLVDELSGAAYQRDNSLLDRVVEWFSQLFHRSTELPGTGSPWAPVVTAVLAVLVIAVLAWVLPRVRREARTRRVGGGVLEDRTLTAADYRERVRGALAGGRYDDALLDAFRALARDAADRALLDGSPGLTAHEISVALAAPFPGHAARLAAAADRFDGVRYGGTHVGRAEAESVANLDLELSRTRPQHAESPVGDAASAPGPAGAGR